VAVTPNDSVEGEAGPLRRGPLDRESDARVLRGGNRGNSRIALREWDWHGRTTRDVSKEAAPGWLDESQTVAHVSERDRAGDLVSLL